MLPLGLPSEEPKHATVSESMKRFFNDDEVGRTETETRLNTLAIGPRYRVAKEGF